MIDGLKIGTIVCIVLALTPAAVPAQTGTIAGTVRVEGNVPAPGLLEVTVDEEFCGDTLRGRDVVVAAGKLAFAVVSIDGAGGQPTPADYTISNNGCLFDPPVLGAGAGSTLLMTNEDVMMHNTHLVLRYGTNGKRMVGNSALPRSGVAIRSTRALRWPGRIDVECDVHPWMHATIWVFDHPYFAVSDATGAFEITEMPVGTYRLRVWHEVLGEHDREVAVRAGEVTQVDIVYQTAAATVGRRERQGASER